MAFDRFGLVAFVAALTTLAEGDGVMDRRRVLFATSNRGKIADVRTLVGIGGMEIVSPDEIRDRGAPPEVVEGVASYLENATRKAEAYFRWSGIPAIGDDTGLEVESLGGAPGIISARYAGEGATARMNTEKLLAALAGTPNRTALFRAVLVLMLKDGHLLSAEGSLHGAITHVPRGGGGFGYDNVFEVAGTGKTLAELKELGSAIATHRHLALRGLLQQLGE